jgi:hypothetical protein
MSIELIIVFFLVLLMLKASLFKTVSVSTIVGFTIILIFLVMIVQAQDRMQENFEDTQKNLVYLQGLAASAAVGKPKESNEGAHDGGGNVAHDQVKSSAAEEAEKKNIDVAVEETITEDIDMLTKNVHLGQDLLMFYYSVFSPISYKVTSNIWQTAAGTVGPLQMTEAPFKYISEKNLVKGIPLFQNKIKGADSSAMGLRGEADFTIHIMMRLGQLRKSNENLEVFTLYSADPKASDPIGISMMLREVEQSAVQSAEIAIKLSNNAEPFTCMVDGNPKIPLELDNTVIISLSKSVSQLSIYMSKATNQGVVKILQANNIQPCFQFVNLPVSLNPNGNVDASVLVFGGHGSAFDQDQVCGVHGYLYKTYKKMNDKEYLQALSKVRELEKEYKAITACPLDNDGCSTCDDIKDWANMSQIITASQRCHEKISSYCATNPKTELCKCWDAGSPTYMLPTCKALRDSFAGKEMLDMNALSDDEIRKIKSRYEICKPPAPSPSPSPPAAPPPVPTPPPPVLPTPPPPTCPTPPQTQVWPTTAPIVTPSPPPKQCKKKAKPPAKARDTGFFSWLSQVFSAGDEDDSDDEGGNYRGGVENPPPYVKDTYDAANASQPYF